MVNIGMVTNQNSLTAAIQPDSDPKMSGSVFCWNYPYDLRPALDALQMEINRRVRKGRPLVVLMGENHGMPTHIALKQCLMARLLSSSSAFAFGMERRCNLLQDMIIKSFRYPFPETLQKIFDQTDRNGEYLLSAYTVAVSADNAPVTDKNLMLFCQSKGISVRANDAPIHQSFFADELFHPCLDTKNLLTRDLIAHYTSALPGENISAVFKEGMHLRNRIMVKRALDHMRETHVPIYIQGCGLSHIYGKDNLYPYSESLSFLFAEVGIDVLPVFISTMFYDENIIPAQAKTMQQQGLVIEGLCERDFKPDDPYGEDSDANEETLYLEKLNENSGGEIEIIPAEDYVSYGLLWREIKSLIPSWLEEARVRLKKDNGPCPV